MGAGFAPDRVRRVSGPFSAGRIGATATPATPAPQVDLRRGGRTPSKCSSRLVRFKLCGVFSKSCEKPRTFELQDQR
jgi:hypothetical protein